MKMIKTICALLLSAQVLVAAQTLTYNFNTPLTSDVSPYGVAPWLKVELSESVTNTGFTTVTITSLLQDKDEFIGSIGMKLTTTFDYDKIDKYEFDNKYTYYSPDYYNFSSGNNDSDSSLNGYDMVIAFEKGAKNRFNLEDVCKFTAPVPLNTFTPNMIAHIQGIGKCDLSTKLVIPEPNTAWFGVFGVAILFLRKRR